MDENVKMIDLGNRFDGFAVIGLQTGYAITIHGNRSSYTFNFPDMSIQGLRNTVSDFSGCIGLELKPILVKPTMLRCEAGETVVLIGIPLEKQS